MLAQRIEDGLENKGILTLKQKELRDLKAKKEQLVREQNDQNAEFRDKVNSTKQYQLEHERNMVELADRNETYEEKTKRI